MSSKAKVGCVHGRFQPLHLGHIEDYIIPAANKCEHLIIGLTNPDPTLTLPDEANLARSRPQNNPLSFYERLRIVQDALTEKGLKKRNFSIVPFPINFPQLIKFYVPGEAIHFLTIFDEWGEVKVEYLERNGFNTSVLFRKDSSQKMISSTMVRENLVARKNWQQYVASSTVSHVDAIGLRERLKEIRRQII